jgi:hypothetical protein
MPFACTPPGKVARIERLLRETTLSQNEIARAVGVSRSTVAKYAGNAGLSRPAACSARGGRPRGRTQAGADRPPTDLAGLIAECLELLKGQIVALGRKGSNASRTQTLRGIAETSRVLKELSRIAATLGGDAVRDAAGGAGDADELDESQFDALCDDLAVAFERWRERRALPLPPGDADVQPGA